MSTAIIYGTIWGSPISGTFGLCSAYGITGNTICDGSFGEQ